MKRAYPSELEVRNLLLSHQGMMMRGLNLISLSLETGHAHVRVQANYRVGEFTMELDFLVVPSSSVPIKTLAPWVLLKPSLLRVVRMDPTPQGYLAAELVRVYPISYILPFDGYWVIYDPSGIIITCVDNHGYAVPHPAPKAFRAELDHQREFVRAAIRVSYS